MIGIPDEDDDDEPDANADAEQQAAAAAAAAAKSKAVAFLAAKADLKAQITEEKRKMTLKTFVGNQFNKSFKDLSEPEKLELAKQGDATALQKFFSAGAKTYEDLLTEIADVDVPGLEGFTARFEQAKVELAKHVETGTALLSNALWLLNEKKKSERHAAMKSRYEITKNAKMFTPTFGDHFAKVLADAMSHEKTGAIALTVEHDQLDPKITMVFRAGTNAGDAVLQAAVGFMTASAHPMPTKLQTLKSFLNDPANSSRPSAASPIKVHHEVSHQAMDLPDIAAVIGLRERLEYDGMEGANPWLVVTRSLSQRMGPGGFPLPCFAALIVPIEGNIAFFVIKAKFIVEAGC